jgi:two-component system cell cycle response regulator
VALLTISVGLVLPGVIAHAVTQISTAATRLTTSTVKDLTAAMHALGQGDLDRAYARCDATPVVVHSRDEIGEMADRFNAMQDEIAQAARSLDGAREGLRAARRQLVSQNDELESWSSQLEQRVSQRTAELQRAHDELAALATTDPLTGLPNHRALVSAVERELAAAARADRVVSVLFIDIDHFKTLNDTLGHAAGDATLRELAALMRGVLRSADTVGRWGGEEFIAVLPETTSPQALDLAERMRSAVAEHRLDEYGITGVTCSIGTATFPGDGHDRATLIDRADRAMYAAKRMGRNQSFAASDPATSAVSAGTAGSDSVQEAALAGDHMDAVATLARSLAVELGLDPTEAELVGVAGKLHDLGKVGIPDAVLRKQAALTPSEWELMRTHPSIGADVLMRVPSLQEVAPLVRGHHERWDGAGYPDALAGDAIPLGARIVAVADAFGAITSDRPYRRARDCRWAVEEIRRGAGAQFDPDVVVALERLTAQEPAGLVAY